MLLISGYTLTVIGPIASTFNAALNAVTAALGGTKGTSLDTVTVSSTPRMSTTTRAIGCWQLTVTGVPTVIGVVTGVKVQPNWAGVVGKVIVA
jgi:hypothetical protein